MYIYIYIYNNYEGVEGLMEGNFCCKKNDSNIPNNN